MKIPFIRYIQGRNYSSDNDARKFAIAIHNTSNPGATAYDEANYATRRTDSVSSHFYADRTTIIQSLDTSVEAWHAGSSQGNNNAIAVEITGANSWSRQQWINNVNWDLLGQVLAEVMEYHNIPLRRPSISEMIANSHVGGIYTHDEMRRAWGGTTHTDPGPNFPMDVLFASISKWMNGNQETAELPEWIQQMIFDLPALHSGWKGEHVQTWQGILKARGYSTVMDGIFGPNTERDTKTLQSRYGVPANGTVDAATWKIGLLMHK